MKRYSYKLTYYYPTGPIEVCHMRDFFTRRGAAKAARNTAYYMRRNRPDVLIKSSVVEIDKQGNIVS